MLLPFFIHVIKLRTIKCLPIFVTFGEFMIIVDITPLFVSALSSNGVEISRRDFVTNESRFFARFAM